MAVIFSAFLLDWPCVPVHLLPPETRKHLFVNYFQLFERGKKQIFPVHEWNVKLLITEVKCTEFPLPVSACRGRNWLGYLCLVSCTCTFCLFRDTCTFNKSVIFLTWLMYLLIRVRSRSIIHLPKLCVMSGQVTVILVEHQNTVAVFKVKLFLKSRRDLMMSGNILTLNCLWILRSWRPSCMFIFNYFLARVSK